MYYKQNPKGPTMKTTIILLAALLLGGCSKIDYYRNPLTGEIKLSYSRIGDQKLNGGMMEMYPDGRVDVMLESQESEARLMQDAIGLFKAGMEAAKQ
jgi:major membrane immunogen (membrane-anchored lipoprotein)